MRWATSKVRDIGKLITTCFSVKYPSLFLSFFGASLIFAMGFSSSKTQKWNVMVFVCVFFLSFSVFFCLFVGFAANDARILALIIVIVLMDLVDSVIEFQCWWWLKRLLMMTLRCEDHQSKFLWRHSTMVQWRRNIFFAVHPSGSEVNWMPISMWRASGSVCESLASVIDLLAETIVCETKLYRKEFSDKRHDRCLVVPFVRIPSWCVWAVLMILLTIYVKHISISLEAS